MNEQQQHIDTQSHGSVALTADIVSAFVSNNSTRPADLPDLIASVHSALLGLGQAPAPVAVEPPTPAVPIKKSVSNDFIICLEDGKKYRSLKRHLGTVYGMTPDEYRAKWGLPKDYPMVAPAYSATRSLLAKTIGLGKKAEPEQAAEGETEADVTTAEVADAPRKRGRKKATA